MPPSTRDELRAAANAAEDIMRCYPQADARASVEFLGELTKFLAALTEEELGWVMDVRRGVRARCKFLPTPADIMEVVNERRGQQPAPPAYQRFEPSPWTEEDERRARQRARYRPFPKLFDLIEADGTPELLRQRFDVLFDASKMLATQGEDAARRVLRHGKETPAEGEKRLADLVSRMPVASDASQALKGVLQRQDEEGVSWR